MISTLMIASMALLNRLRGWDIPFNGPQQILWLKSKYAIALYAGAIFGLYASSWYVFAIVTCGIAFWASRGWGDYFDFSSKPNNEITIIDDVLDIFDNGPLKDTIAMSLRGAFLYVMFIALSLYTHSIEPLFIGALSLLQGPIYFAWHLIDKDDVRGIKTAGSELTMGALIGLMLTGAL